jgi:hypothetical protein
MRASEVRPPQGQVPRWGRQDVSAFRPSPRTLAFALVGVAMVGSAIVAAYWGRGHTFGLDEMAYARRLSEQSLGHALVYPPSNGYMIAAPLLVYKLMFETIGLGSYPPYRAVSIALELLCAGLFFLLARRRVGDLWAVPPTVLLLFFGYGWEELLTAERIPGLMALATGLGTLLVLTHETRRGDAAAAVLLTISLASHPSGLAFVSGAAVLILFRAPPERWRSAWVFLGPAALYAAWYLFLRLPGTTPTQTHLSELASFVGQSWTATTAAVSGLAGILDGSAYHHTLGWLAGALLFVLVAAGVATRARKLPPSFWAAAAALLTLWVITGVTRGDALITFYRPADAPRYLYPAAFLLLLLVVELAGAVRLPAWGAWAATGVLALGLVANLDRLHDAGNQSRLTGASIRAAFGATEIAAATVRPAFAPAGFLYPSAGEYLDIVRAFGSPAYSPTELGEASPRLRQVADGTLFGAMRLEARPAHRTPSGRARPLRLEKALQGTAATVGGCLNLKPVPGAAVFAPQPSVLPPPPVMGSASPPALAEVTLPPGGVSVAADRLDDVGMRLGRFADPPALPLKTPRSGDAASLAIPEDRVAVPWKLVVYSREPVSLCGL